MDSMWTLAITVGLVHVIYGDVPSPCSLGTLPGTLTPCIDGLKTAFGNVKRPFLPDEFNLNAFLNINFDNEDISFTYCCEETKYQSSNFNLYPTTNDRVLAGQVSVDSTVTASVVDGQNLDSFKDNMFSMLCVDPDVPYDTAGTKERPLLHWLATDVTVNANGTLVIGNDIHFYRGPMPPDQAVHYYYFMLYEQKDGLSNINDTVSYAGEQCNERLTGRCLFDVNKFVSENNLKLTALTWMSAKNDDWVNYTRGVDESEACVGRDSYPCTSASKAVALFASAVLPIILMMLFRAIVFV